MEGNVWVVSIILLSCLIIILCYIKRNDSVCSFRLRLIDIIFESKDWKILLKTYINGPSYNDMLYSFRPLRLEKWYDNEFLKKLFE